VYVLYVVTTCEVVTSSGDAAVLCLGQDIVLTVETVVVTVIQDVMTYSVSD
jgi:hypothetical protein